MTFSHLKPTAAKFGLRATFGEAAAGTASGKAAVRPNPKLFYGETTANPQSEILDIEAVAAAAHEVGVPLVVDNTIATPYLLRPLEWGADVVLHSATQSLGIHGASIAGVIVYVRTFDFAKDPEKFPNYNTPCDGYN